MCSIFIWNAIEHISLYYVYSTSIVYYHYLYIDLCFSNVYRIEWKLKIMKMLEKEKIDFCCCNFWQIFKHINGMMNNEFIWKKTHKCLSNMIINVYK